MFGHAGHVLSNADENTFNFGQSNMRAGRIHIPKPFVLHVPRCEHRGGHLTSLGDVSFPHADPPRIAFWTFQS
jgi:hypothetical protein